MALLDAESKELEKQLEVLETRIDRLRSLYEQYFQGIEKIEPSLERTALKNLLNQMRKTRTRNTVLRFRLNQMIARLNTYETYWTRVCRQIEDGTWHRDIAMARYRSQSRAGKPEVAEPAGAEAAPAPAERRAEPAEAPAANTGVKGGLNDSTIKAIYDAYVMARRRCKEPVKGLTPEALASSLRRQVPQIIKQHNCKSVEFKVVIKQGRAVLKVVPKF